MTRQPVEPRRQLGQHFLTDRNILGVIERLGDVSPGDVVLEVGPGLGVLTEFLAERARYVHAVEIDRTLAPHLDERLRQATNVALRYEDALSTDVAGLGPAPTKLIANLPYSIATPLVTEGLDGMPAIDRWCVMVQREVADRLVARPGTRAYGAVSVLVQLTTRRVGFHAVARTCFRPPPNVDSALVALVRTRSWGTEYAGLKRLVRGAFLHRRKTLANSLDQAGLAERADVASAMVALGHDAGGRAESLSPAEFEQLAERLL
ncbi:MAG: 16S rRNA (adenine(1518)-N(6)/adenine(1519)-N(6))-dimethyltransferase RsmA [Actinomycetia bacterium]|nr:16S rRNA (adenine(1518)-N(6)/adenine(1519)-N(6))-dimethyltransferase RsmA [Actinomycetes bacterium]